MSVSRSQTDQTVYYAIESKVTFRILLSFTVDYVSNSEYQNGKLIRETTNNKLNGSTQKESALWYNGTHYTLESNGTRSELDQNITYSVAAIYFEEPVDGQKVFSPQFGEFLTFEKVDEHQYQLESPDGLNVYSYTNGICTEVKVNRDFAKFYFRMTPESLEVIKTANPSSGPVVVD